MKKAIVQCRNCNHRWKLKESFKNEFHDLISFSCPHCHTDYPKILIHDLAVPKWYAENRTGVLALVGINVFFSIVWTINGLADLKESHSLAAATVISFMTALSSFTTWPVYYLMLFFMWHQKRQRDWFWLALITVAICSIILFILSARQTSAG